MPLDFQNLRPQLDAYVQQSHIWKKRIDTIMQQAVQVLREWSGKTEAIQTLIQQTAQSDPSLRCAVPTQESWMEFFPPSQQDSVFHLLAADGSQIYPDTHQALFFGLINIGSIIFPANSSDAPKTEIKSALLDLQETFTPNGIISEELLGLMRNVQERTYLASQCTGLQGLTIALTDGPLELYHEPKIDDAFQRLFSDYLQALQTLAQQHVIFAGYVDKPRADLIVRTLEILAGTQIPQSAARPFAGLGDANLLKSILPPKHRSAVMQIRSRSTASYMGEIALHFFYLNVGNAHKPWIVRVEVPEYVSRNSQYLQLLHDTLLAQCQIMGAQPYPYVLHRAHEIAVVRLAEKQELERMLWQHLEESGLHAGTTSPKQMAKNLSGRTRL